ncbi:hypothetical protein JOM56_000528 [Amanita muscaria]
MSPSLQYIPLVLLQLISLPTFSSAYSWVFNSAPQQCSNVSISITGSDGQPPYRVLVIPFGPTPLPNNTEVRKIIDHSFTGDSTSTTFPINFPANSQFVAVVSDATGFGTGGTSVAAQITSSSDSSCFNAIQQVSPLFVFSIEPQNQIVQCQSTRIWWDNSTVQGTPNFLGVIPGGQSFSIPESQITNVQSEGTGFSWTPSLRGGTTLMIVGGDDRGNGTAGSSFLVVSSGTANNGSCLTNNSPSSTPGSPAGGSYPTSTSGSGTGGGGGGGANVGAIVGGILGALAIVVVSVLLFYFLRRREKNKSKDHPVDLINADEDEEAGPPDINVPGSRSSRNELPEFYRPEPYLVAESDRHTETTSMRSGERSRRISTVTSQPETMSQIGFGYGDPSVGSSSGRKGLTPRPYRAVNIVQHEDAGPSEAPVDGEEAETIELPPAYTNLRSQVTTELT